MNPTPRIPKKLKSGDPVETVGGQRINELIACVEYLNAELQRTQAALANLERRPPPVNTEILVCVDEDGTETQKKMWVWGTEPEDYQG